MDLGLVPMTLGTLHRHGRAIITVSARIVLGRVVLGTLGHGLTDGAFIVPRIVSRVAGGWMGG